LNNLSLSLDIEESLISFVFMKEEGVACIEKKFSGEKSKGYVQAKNLI